MVQITRERAKEWFKPPTKEQLEELKKQLETVKYRTRTGRKLAERLYQITEQKLTSPFDIYWILGSELPEAWAEVLRSRKSKSSWQAVTKLGWDARDMLETWLKWLNSIGYVLEWTIEGEEDWYDDVWIVEEGEEDEGYSMVVYYLTMCHEIGIGLTIRDREVETWQDYYSIFCSWRNE